MSGASWRQISWGMIFKGEYSGKCLGGIILGGSHTHRVHRQLLTVKGKINMDLYSASS